MFCLCFIFVAFQIIGMDDNKLIDLFRYQSPLKLVHLIKTDQKTWNSECISVPYHGSSNDLVNFFQTSISNTKLPNFFTSKRQSLCRSVKINESFMYQNMYIYYKDKWIATSWLNYVSYKETCWIHAYIYWKIYR